MDVLDGVFANALRCGLKRSALDLAYLYVPQATGSAGVFTQHSFAASSVVETRQKVANLKAVLINSGNANACTGSEGAEHTRELIAAAAEHLGISVDQVGMASTGVIGKPLDLACIKSGMERLFEDPFVQNYDLAAEAILTTDSCSKTAYRDVLYQKQSLRAFGMTKGSGMIAPNMATTLTFVVLSVDLPSDMLQEMLAIAVDRSFNRISVDSDTSTNDMVLCFASGQHSLDWKDLKTQIFVQDLLDDLCLDLAKQVVLDGEGATKLIEVCVEGAKDEAFAVALAKQVVDSPLVKTAIHGQDANWGRLLMAIGKSADLPVDPQSLTLFLGKHKLFLNGEQRVYNKEEMINYLCEDHIVIRYCLGQGSARASVFGCDLSAAYVSINTAYN